MSDWIDYYDSTHTIYVSKRHRDVHFAEIARDIIAYIPSPDAIVVDYACGEALSAPQVASACGKLILAEPAPGVRARVAQRFQNNPKIEVRSLDDLADAPAQSADLVIMNSVSQYMSFEQIDTAFAVIRRLLKPSGTFVLGDVVPPDNGLLHGILALLTFAAKHGFLIAALKGLVMTALSDYRQLRTRIGLQHYSEAEMLQRLTAAGFEAKRAARNIGHNPWRMTFVCRPR